MTSMEMLERRYGAPGRIVFRQGHGGWPNVILANKYGVAEVALLGANVLSYRPTGHSEVLFRPAKRDYNRGESLHGGIPLCWPQFGKLALPGMMPHGFARLMPFKVRGSQYSDEMTELTLGLTSDAETEKLWPHSFDLEVKISVSMKLNISAETKNTGTEPFAFSCGFHPYILVRERDRSTVEGLDGKSFVDAKDMSEKVQSGSLVLDSSVDSVFTLEDAPKHGFAVMDNGLGRAVAVACNGARRLVVWNPGPETPLPDLAEGDWRRFVCVEPVTSWPDAGAPLAPGESRILRAALQSSLPDPGR